MVQITLETEIKAPIELVFDLARSIDLHLIAAKDKKEKAIAGTTTGLISENETVTWEAEHMGGTQTLTSKVTKMTAPTYFKDEMIEGAFSSVVHEHHFVEKGDITSMVDVFTFVSPFGFFGKLANALFLKRYMKNILIQKNAVLKDYAESDKHLEILAKAKK